MDQASLVVVVEFLATSKFGENVIYRTVSNHLFAVRAFEATTVHINQASEEDHEALEDLVDILDNFILFLI